MSRAIEWTQTYTIKPLPWEHTVRDDHESWTAQTVFCTVEVSRNTWDTEDGAKWSAWKFSYCRDEYYDEHSETVDDAEDGKAKAEAWYMKTLAPALVAAEAARRSKA